MDAATLSAMSALLGSVVGASASVATTWLGQRYSSHREQTIERVRKRESLYAEFIDEAARLRAESYEKKLDSAQTVVTLIAALNRIRLLASKEVVVAAEKCVDEIIDSYFSPNLSLQQLHDKHPWRKHNSLAEFSEACRRELVGS